MIYVGRPYFEVSRTTVGPEKSVVSNALRQGVHPKRDDVDSRTETRSRVSGAQRSFTFGTLGFYLSLSVYYTNHGTPGRGPSFRVGSPYVGGGRSRDTGRKVPGL